MACTSAKNFVDCSKFELFRTWHVHDLFTEYLRKFSYPTCVPMRTEMPWRSAVELDSKLIHMWDGRSTLSSQLPCICPERQGVPSESWLGNTSYLWQGEKRTKLKAPSGTCQSPGAEFSGTSNRLSVHMWDWRVRGLLAFPQNFCV